MAPPVLAFRIRQALEGTSMGPVAGVPRPAAADTGASRPALGGLSALMQSPLETIGKCITQLLPGKPATVSSGDGGRKTEKPEARNPRDRKSTRLNSSH